MASMASYNMPSVKNCDMASMLGKCELKCLQWLATKTVSLFLRYDPQVGALPQQGISTYSTQTCAASVSLVSSTY